MSENKDDRLLVSQLFEEAAQELERAAKHFSVAAQHFREKEIPRGCAHAFAAQGHIKNAQEKNAAASKIHAGRASV